MSTNEAQWHSPGVPRGHTDGHALIGAIRVMHSEAEASALLTQLEAPDHPMVVSFANQHAFNLSSSVPGFAELLAGSDLLLRDGVGMEVAMSFLGLNPGLNMHGTAFIPRIAQGYRGRRVALYGTVEPWVGRAAEALRGLGCNVVSVRDGFHPVKTYIDAVAADAPELVILAMGMPKQEQVAFAIARAARTPLVIANGGAIADFLAERSRRAPAWVQSARLEWAFRMGGEPHRLWRRYILGGVTFAWSILRLKVARSVPAYPPQPSWPSQTTGTTP